MDSLVTCDTIIAWLQSQYEQKLPVSPSVFIDAAEKMNILISDEHKKLFNMQQKVAQMKVDLLSGSATAKKPSVAEVKLRVEASDEFRAMCVQKAKIERIIEHIRLAKIHSRMASEEIKGLH